MRDDLLTDPSELRRQYGAAANLAARQSIWEYQDGPSLFDAALDLACLTGTETIVDVGCGNGRYLAALHARGHRGVLLGLDLSPGMAAGSARYAGAAVADARRLPIRTGAADVALAMHMLYHVPDIAAAIAELRRTVRPGGIALVATNGTDHVAEVRDLLRRAARDVTGGDLALPWSTSRFSAELATEYLAGSFADVVAHPRRQPVRVPAAEPVIGYLRSLPAAAGLDVPGHTAVLDRAADLVRAEIAEHGCVTVTAAAVVFVCR